MKTTPAPAANANLRVVYQLGREGRYHFIGGVLILFAVVMGWLAAFPSAPEPSDSLVVEPETATQAAQSVLLILLGLAPFTAWLWFSRRFVRRIAWDTRAGDVEIELFRHIGRATLRVQSSDIGAVSHHEDRSDFTDAPSVRAPYTRMRVRGRPLILDQQGNTLDRPALSSLLAGRAPKSRRAKPDTPR